MKDDLVERLREVGRDGVWKSGRNPASAHPMCIEAAATIAAQAVEIARLREALFNSVALIGYCMRMDETALVAGETLVAREVWQQGCAALKPETDNG